MFKLFIVPMIVGILVFLLIYFISPVLFPESDILSIVAELALYLSNLYFDSMPPFIANYIASLNLAIAALTVGLSMAVVVLLLVIIGSMLVYLTKWITSHLQRDRTEDKAPDLPSLDMDSRFNSSEKEAKVLGRGLDSIDRD